MPVTAEQHETEMREAALCEQLPVRDYLDNVVVRTNGSFVAGYQLKGMTSYFATDEERNRGKVMLEALLRSVPEQSMRVQFRYEMVEDLGDLLDRYVALQKSERRETVELDEVRVLARRLAIALYWMWRKGWDYAPVRVPATTASCSATLH